MRGENPGFIVAPFGSGKGRSLRAASPSGKEIVCAAMGACQLAAKAAHICKCGIVW
jgi:hypothetical protein